MAPQSPSCFMVLLSPIVLMILGLGCGKKHVEANGNHLSASSSHQPEWLECARDDVPIECYSEHPDSGIIVYWRDAEIDSFTCDGLCEPNGLIVDENGENWRHELFMQGNSRYTNERTGESIFIPLRPPREVRQITTQPRVLPTCTEEPFALVERIYAAYVAENPQRLHELTCWTDETHALLVSRPFPYDPVVQGQDFDIRDVHISILEHRGEGGSHVETTQTAFVLAKFSNSGTPTEVVWEIVNNDGWRVVDLVSSGNSFVDTLKSLPPDRAFR
jgi:hypothetical protein